MCAIQKLSSTLQARSRSDLRSSRGYSQLTHGALLLSFPVQTLRIFISGAPPPLSLSHTHTRTHTHFLLTPAWPFTPLQINMCNSGEILHHHGNQASCPMESRAVNHAVWFPSPLLPSPLSYYDFAYFYLFVYFCVFVIVYFCCRGVLVISLLISGFLRTTTFHTSSF